jgi:hypothetical protein
MNDNVTVIKKSGRKDEQRRQQLVMALLQQPSLKEAAKTVGISEVTAWRISKTPEFQEEYRQVKHEAFEQSLGRLQQASSTAVSTLLNVMEDLKNPAAVRLRAAECILKHGSENFDQGLAERVQSIEQRVTQMIEDYKILGGGGTAV